MRRAPPRRSAIIHWNLGSRSPDGDASSGKSGDTLALIREFISLGFRTAVVCVDPAQLDPSFLGRLIDEEFLSQLPPGVDPCGESGEFHTFVFDGPMFRHPVKFVFGEKICRDSFWFCDLLPAG